MRVIRYVLIYLVIFICIAVVGILSAQRILLYVGKQQLISAVTELMSYSNQSTYVSQCRQINREFGQESSSTEFQLRFEDDQSYVLESVCLALPDRPIVISRGSLPKYVTKLPGSSGFVMSSGMTQVKIRALGMITDWLQDTIPQLTFLVSPTATISLADGKLIVPNPGEVPVQGPATVCAGYGYTCCDAIAEIGEGESIAALDCANQCFTRCASRPALLSFTAAPNFDHISRKVVIGPNQQVEFWLVSTSDSTRQASIDFGDGQRFSGDFDQQPIIHTYQCDQETCVYQVSARVIDATGQQSAPGTNTALQVEVQQGAY